MTFYEYLRRLAEIIAPESSGALFDYIIHSMDNDGGFLRSRWCRWDDELIEIKGDFGDIRTALVAVRDPELLDKPEEYYGEDFGGQITTRLKMQLFYYDHSDKGGFDDSAQWSADMGYPAALKVDMENGTYEVIEYDERC